MKADTKHLASNGHDLMLAACGYELRPKDGQILINQLQDVTCEECLKAVGLYYYKSRQVNAWEKYNA